MTAITDEAIAAAAKQHADALEQLDRALAVTGKTARALLAQLSEAETSHDDPDH